MHGNVLAVLLMQHPRILGFGEVHAAIWHARLRTA